MSGPSTETPLPERQWLEDLKRQNPDVDPDNVRYLAEREKRHLANHDHQASVKQISTQVERFYENNQHFRIYHGSTNSTRRTKFDPTRMVDTSSLNHVLHVDRQQMTALVEPNVPMDSLVSYLQPYDLVPPVVMEFPGITVGGGFAGTSGESSSFKYGFFDKTVTRIEIVLGDGRVLHASDTEHEDLFKAAAGSFGTFGVVTALELKLVPSTFWVELKYWPIKSIAEALDVIQERVKDESIDYLDGILYEKNLGVIVTGRRHNQKSLNGREVVRFSRDYDPWFYLHAQCVLQCSTSCRQPCSLKCKANSVAPVSDKTKVMEPYTDHTPVADYLFRYDRGAFWTGRYAFSYFLVPFTWLTRLILDYFMHTRVMYHALHESGQSDLYIIQDLAIPLSSTEKFIEYLDDEFKLYPLWLCPLKPTDDGEKSFHPVGKGNGEMLINVGVWGPGPRTRPAFVQKNRELEAKVRELGGMKWLYAQAYYTAEEFWSIYDREWYDALRKKWNAQRLPNVYDKVKTDVEDNRSIKRKIMMAIWPLSGIYGVLKALLGGSYLTAVADRRGASFLGLGWVPIALVFAATVPAVLLSRSPKGRSEIIACLDS